MTWGGECERQTTGAGSRDRKIFVDLEVVTPVVMNSSVFWHITPCSLLKINKRFGGSCRLHHQSRKKSHSTNQLGDTLLGNVDWLSADFRALYPRK
jgi:hypothetical protein